MKGQDKIKVLMLGPDRRVHGGISAVVNNFYDAGLDEKISLAYIGTMVDGSKLRKLLKAVGAFGMFLVKAPGYQIIHVNMASDSSYHRKAVFIKTAKLLGKKIVIHQHGGDFESFYYKEQDERGRAKIDRVLSMGDAFLVLAPYWQNFFSHMVPRERITLLPNTILLPKQGEKEYGQHRLLFLGRLCRNKGIEELLKALSSLRQEYPDIRLYLGGIWEDQELKQEAERRGDFVTWLGWVKGKEKEEYLQLCDIFVLPSYFEGQPVSVLEAMGAGCAVVASQVGGIPQMITEGETGVLVAPKDAGSLEEGLRRVLSNAELCRHMGEQARKKVEKEFSIESSMDKLLEIYRKVLGLS